MTTNSGCLKLYGQAIRGDSWRSYDDYTSSSFPSAHCTRSSSVWLWLLRDSLIMPRSHHQDRIHTKLWWWYIDSHGCSKFLAPPPSPPPSPLSQYANIAEGNRGVLFRNTDNASIQVYQRLSVRQHLASTREHLWRDIDWNALYYIHCSTICFLRKRSLRIPKVTEPNATPIQMWVGSVRITR